MVRTTKADLVASNAELQEEVAKLKAENARLQEEKPRARSRSPRRVVGSAANMHRALNLVLPFERDQVIQEQKETIVRQQKEIQALREGKGPIGQVLMAIRDEDYPTLAKSEFIIEKLTNETTPVCQIIRKLERLSAMSNDLVRWGSTSKVLK